MTDDDFILAAYHGDIWAVELYLAEGGNLEARSSWSGEGALIARDPELFNYLLQRGADPLAEYNPLASQVWEVCPDNVETLLALGVDPNAGRPHQPNPLETPLHLAVSRSDHPAARLRIVQALLHHGARPNARCATEIASPTFGPDVMVIGETPLHRAAAYCDLAIVESLLAAGADPAIRDKHGETPKAWACRHWRPPSLIEKLTAQVN